MSSMLYHFDKLDLKQTSILIIKMTPMLFHMKKLLLILLCSSFLALEHEKSYFVQNEVSNVLAVAMYGESLLSTSTNDIVRKRIETGKVERSFRAHSNSI